MKPQPQIQPSGPVRLETRFGTFEVAESDMISFPEGLPGFEQCRRFVVIAAGDLAPLQALHAVDGAATFLAIDPRLVLPGYRCQLSGHDAKRLGAEAGDALLWLALVTVTEDGDAYANLRAPIVVNAARMTGYQVMPLNTLYPLRQPLTTAE